MYFCISFLLLLHNLKFAKAIILSATQDNMNNVQTGSNVLELIQLLL